MTFLDKIKGWLMEIVEVGLILIALGVVLQILLGSPLPFIGNVVQNLMTLIKVLGDGGLIGLIAIAVLLWLFSKRRPA
ncbi:MAG: hypothetical protein V3S92_03660 [Alphaproteobacteria bacterium]|nr:hypothetical protein [Alphaproteobacteria bacterium]